MFCSKNRMSVGREPEVVVNAKHKKILSKLAPKNKTITKFIQLHLVPCFIHQMQQCKQFYYLDLTQLDLQLLTAVSKEFSCAFRGAVLIIVVCM